MAWWWHLLWPRSTQYSICLFDGAMVEGLAEKEQSFAQAFLCIETCAVGKGGRLRWIWWCCFICFTSVIQNTHCIAMLGTGYRVASTHSNKLLFYVVHTYVWSFCGQHTKGAFHATSLRWHAARIAHRPTSHALHSPAHKQYVNTDDRDKHTCIVHSKDTIHI